MILVGAATSALTLSKALKRALFTLEANHKAQSGKCQKGIDSLS